jgi:hypothetical protein
VVVGGGCVLVDVDMVVGVGEVVVVVGEDVIVDGLVEFAVVVVEGEGPLTAAAGGCTFELAIPIPRPAAALSRPSSLKGYEDDDKAGTTEEEERPWLSLSFSFPSSFPFSFIASSTPAPAPRFTCPHPPSSLRSLLLLFPPSKYAFFDISTTPDPPTLPIFVSNADIDDGVVDEAVRGIEDNKALEPKSEFDGFDDNFEEGGVTVVVAVVFSPIALADVVWACGLGFVVVEVGDETCCGAAAAALWLWLFVEGDCWFAGA